MGIPLTLFVATRIVSPFLYLTILPIGEGESVGQTIVVGPLFALLTIGPVLDVDAVDLDFAIRGDRQQAAIVVGLQLDAAAAFQCAAMVFLAL